LYIGRICIIAQDEDYRVKGSRIVNEDMDEERMVSVVQIRYYAKQRKKRFKAHKAK